MSLAATIIAYEAMTGDPIAKLVLIALADFADDTGRSVLAAEDLARFAQCDGARVLVALEALRAAGLIAASGDAYVIRGVAP